MLLIDWKNVIFFKNKNDFWVDFLVVSGRGVVKDSFFFGFLGFFDKVVGSRWLGFGGGGSSVVGCFFL